METQPRIPVVWLHGLECTCCSESFIRSSHPIAQDVVLNMISLDYDDTLQAAAGFQAEAIRKNLIKNHPGGYLLAVEGNAPTALACSEVSFSTSKNVSWNASPKDAKGQHGAYESALLGTPMADPKQPLEILRTIHSFDPCPACASHLLGKDGRKLSEVVIRA
jgi:hypothetical protein